MNVEPKLQFYRVVRGDLWGDFGDVLVHGMAGFKDELNALELDRTGPYLPAITCPAFGGLCVSDSMRPIVAAAFPHLSFGKVVTGRVVEIPWETWDLTAEEPPIYPESGEPEDYIYQGANSPEAAAALGPIWQLVFPTRVLMKAWPHKHPWLAPLSVVKSTWDGTDVFGAWIKAGQYPIVTERGKDFFLKHAAQWLSFQPLPPEEELPTRAGAVLDE